MSRLLMNENEKWNKFIETPLYTKVGKVHSVQEQFFVAKGPKAKIGDVCFVGEHNVLCEVIAIEKKIICYFHLNRQKSMLWRFSDTSFRRCCCTTW